MSRVIIKNSSYDYRVLKPHVFDMLDALGGGDINRRTKVLIKPNFLVPAGPETAVDTHPLVIRAVVEYVLKKDVKPQISDSPAMGSFDRVLKASGTLDALQGLPVFYKPFQNSLPVDIGEPFGQIEIADDALQADFVINLPKLKTHNLMGLTLGVKNLFGCVVGFKKPEWHLKMGTNNDMLARLFVRIHEAVRPRITLLDGILAMEGEGPGRGGTPRQLGLLAGSTDAYALDESVCRLLGIEPDRIPTIKCAREMGLVGESVEIDSGEEAIRLEIGDFKLPHDGRSSGLLGRFQDLFREFLLARPVVSRHHCSLCGACWEICPAKAVSGCSGRLQFDYDQCIRCYCCTEVCPQGALRIRTPVLGRLIKQALNV